MKNKESIKNEIKNHEISIKSLKDELNIVKNKKPYNGFKGAYLKTMRTCTNPFANYNKNINNYLKDPKLHYLKKDIEKAEKFIKKILNLNEETLKISKIEKYLKALDKVQVPLLLNSKPILQRIPPRQKLKLDKTLKALKVINEWLFDQKLLLNVEINEEEEQEENIEKQAEELMTSIGKNLEKLISKS
jgi:hypothetical protein